MMIKSILSNFHMYTYIALFILISFMYIEIESLSIDVKSCEFQVIEYEKNIEYLEKESKIRQDIIDIAYKNAENNIEQVVYNSNKILEENVSNNCQDAMKWAIERAKTL